MTFIGTIHLCDVSKTDDHLLDCGKLGRQCEKNREGNVKLKIKHLGWDLTQSASGKRQKDEMQRKTTYTQGESGHLQAKERGFGKSQLCRHHDHGLLASRTVIK